VISGESLKSPEIVTVTVTATVTEIEIEIGIETGIETGIEKEAEVGRGIEKAIVTKSLIPGRRRATRHGHLRPLIVLFLASTR
jgi:hypothetical protein